MELLAGSIGLFKKPSSHRGVDYADPVVATEIILLADLPLRLLDERRRPCHSEAPCLKSG
jgi:hypothetical protein